MLTLNKIEMQLSSDCEFKEQIQNLDDEVLGKSINNKNHII